MAWTVVYLYSSVQAEVEALSADLRSKFQRIVELVRAKGLEQVREPTSSTWKTSSGKCGWSDATASRARSTSPRAASASWCCMPSSKRRRRRRVVRWKLHGRARRRSYEQEVHPRRGELPKMGERPGIQARLRRAGGGVRARSSADRCA